MLCDNCNENEATVHIIKIINNKKEEINLCEKCAKEMQGFNMPVEQFDMPVMGKMDFAPPLPFQNILSGIMDLFSGTQVAPSNKVSNITCKNCGMTYDEFKKTGLLGCDECYRVFAPYIDPIIKRVQNGVEHTGKIPKKSGNDIVERRRILKLKEELQKAIAVEEYEKAAEIRDAIKELEDDE